MSLKKLLYIEDDKALARLVQRRLDREGFKVDIASDGEAGLKKIRANNYHTVIVDYKLPGIDGLQLVKTLSQEHLLPPTIMISGVSDIKIAIEAMKLGVSDFLIKEINGGYLDLLLPTIQRVLNVQRLVQKKKQAQKALRKTLQQQTAILNNISDLAWMKDRKHRFIAVNEPFAKACGEPCEKLIGKTDLDIWPEALAHRYRADDREVMRAKIRKRVEEPLVDSNGHESWIETIKTPIFNGKGKVIGTAGIARDITQRKRFEETLRKSKEGLAEAQRIAHLGSWEWDVVNKKFMWSRETYRIFGLTPGESETSHDAYWHAIHPDDREFVDQAFDNTLSKAQPCSLDHRIIRPNGEVRFVHQEAEVKSDPQGNPKRIVGTVQDVTENKEVEKELRLAAAVFEETSEGIFVTDVKNRLQIVNQAFMNITGYSEEDVRGKDPSILSSGRHDSAFYKQMWHSLQTEGRWKGEIWNRRKNGEIYPQWLSITAIRDSSDNHTGFVAIFSDITQRKQYEEQIWRQAHFDTLTGLPNRSLFIDRLSQEVAHAHRNHSRLVLMFIDIDHFKWVNDSLGHAAGDRLLQEGAKRILKCVRASDTVARLGGDEFTVILPQANERGIERIARKILDLLVQPFALTPGQETHVSGSIGIAVYPNNGKDTEELIKNADTAMYRAKAAGRNTCEFFTDEMNASAVRRTRLEAELRHALVRDELTLFYQPIVNLHTGQIAGAEALLRWYHPNKGMISPMEFIPLAEETGLIVAIGEWVFTRASEQILSWQRADLKLPFVSLNVSGRQCRDKRFQNQLKSMVKRLALPKGMLVLEITESMMLDQGEDTQRTLNDVRDMGVLLSVDDFGTAYSCLRYLKRFPVDSLKIDRSFIKNITTDPADASLTTAIINMARSLHLNVVAEGIETAAQRDYLCAAGCGLGQGYYFAQPLPPQEFETLVQREHGCLKRPKVEPLEASIQVSK